jgi:hypothetical protein
MDSCDQDHSRLHVLRNTPEKSLHFSTVLYTKSHVPVIQYDCFIISSFGQYTRMMQSSSANTFLPAFQLHRSGVRFLTAGLYVDAIHTLIQGLETLQVSLRDRRDLTLQAERWRKEYPLEMHQQKAFTVGMKPMNHSCFTNEEWMTTYLQPCCSSCQGSLIAALVYNLALAYHLHALNSEKGANLYSYLNEALKLYSAAETYLRQYGLAASIPLVLENNVRHIIGTISVKHDPRNIQSHS